MDIIKNQHFEGERPLFEKRHLRLEQVTIGEGESAIKECSDIEAEDCHFWGKYPFWHVHGFKINRCQFDAGARSALWYSDHLDMRDTIIDGPKMFREMHDLYLVYRLFLAGCPHSLVQCGLLFLCRSRRRRDDLGLSHG